MNLDIQAERVVVLPEWRDVIEAWMTRCARWHPDVASIDLTLRHDGKGGWPDEKVDVVATASGRTLRAARPAELMTMALHDALDALERELLVHDAVTDPRFRLGGGPGSKRVA